MNRDRALHFPSGACDINVTRVITIRQTIALGLLTSGLAHAAELAIETKPVEVVLELDAQVMPVSDVPLLQVAPKAWSIFSIMRLADHGSAVKKGSVLVAFDAREIDKRIDSLKRQLASSELTIAATQDQLARLEETAAQRLEDAKRAAAEAAEGLDYFTKTGRKATEEDALHDIKRSEQWLENEKEELRQLKQMYEADDLTEDTEEIILTRQKDAVESAELMLRLTKLRQTREIEVHLPRKAQSLANASTQAAVALKYAQREIPREIEQTKSQLETLKANQQKDREQLTDLEEDRKLFELTAPADGVFYHGVVKDGAWVTGDLLRSLKVGAAAPLHTPFASLIPNDAALQLVAQAGAAEARQLAKQQAGIAALAGTDIKGAAAHAIAVTVKSSSPIPDTQGRHEVEFSATWPKSLAIAVGNPAKVHILSYENPKAIVVPVKALKYGASGWSVELKLADGKTERRKVARGAQAGDVVEILSGLEVGQVIIVP